MTTVRLPATPASAALARQRIAADLANAPISAELVDDVVLVATELVSNAVRHAQALASDQVTLTWEVEDQTVTVRVTDGGAASRPRVRHPQPHDTSGRGLALVQALAARWGVEDGPNTTTVWASLTS